MSQTNKENGDFNQLHGGECYDMGEWSVNNTQWPPHSPNPTVSYRPPPPAFAAALLAVFVKTKLQLLMKEFWLHMEYRLSRDPTVCVAWFVFRFSYRGWGLMFAMPVSVAPASCCRSLHQQRLHLTMWNVIAKWSLRSHLFFSAPTVLGIYEARWLYFASINCATYSPHFPTWELLCVRERRFVAT